MGGLLKHTGLSALTLLMVTLCGHSLATHSFAQTRIPKPSESDDVETLVALLADDDFQVRQDAEQRLLEFGSEAIEVLEKHIDAGDNELRLRVIRIIGMIQRNRMDRLIRGFLANRNSLPGWETFAGVVGADKGAREKYVSLYRKRHALLDRHEDDGVELLIEILNEIEQLGSRRATFDAELMACLSLQVIRTLPHPDTESRWARISDPLIRYFSASTMSELTRETHPLAALHRAAAATWITMNDPVPYELSRRIRVAVKLALPEGLVPAVQCLETEDPLPSGTIRNAMVLVGRYGDESQLGLLMKYLDNSLLIHRQQFLDRDIQSRTTRTVTYTTQVGDLALATMIYLAGESYQDFGLNLNLREYPDPVLPPQLSGFATEEERTAGREKWKAVFADSFDEESGTFKKEKSSKP